MKVTQFLIILIFVFFNAFSQKISYNSSANNKILIVADDWDKMVILSDKLKENGAYIISKTEQEQIGSDISDFDFVIMYVHKTLTCQAEQLLIDYSNNGGSLIVLHHGIASAKINNPEWLDFLGIELYPRDHPQYPWGVLSNSTHSMVNMYPGHFITSNKIKYNKTVNFRTDYNPVFSGLYRAFDLPETEIFINQRFKDNRRTILFGFGTGDGSLMQPTSGWYRKTGKGRVFYYQAGHSTQDFENENFLQILFNTLEWQPELTQIPWDISKDRSKSSFESDKFGWKNILPPSNLEGWVELPWPPGSEPDEKFKQFKQQWFVNGNVLLCDSKQGHSHLESNEQYQNFILHAEWRYLPEKGSQNSGILVRMQSGKYVMNQCELAGSKVMLFGGSLSDSVVTLINSIGPESGGEWGKGYQHVSKGWTPLTKFTISPPIPEIPGIIGKSFSRTILPVGEWNTTEILCQNQFIVVWNNGSICSYTDNCTIQKGSIGFESEGHAIEFRNVFVKEL